MIDSTTILDYKIRKPLVETDKKEVLFLLHGYGSNEEDLFSFANYLPKELLIISLRAPMEMGMGGYAWYSIHFDENTDKWSNDEEAKQSRELILKNINYHLAQFELPESHKVMLLGFSQGAILSWSVAFSHPDRISHIVALSGFVNEELFADYPKNSNLKCFSSHGASDPVIPVQWARKSWESVKEKGIELEAKEYPAEHTISAENFSEMVTWLQKRIED